MVQLNSEEQQPDRVAMETMPSPPAYQPSPTPPSGFSHHTFAWGQLVPRQSAGFPVGVAAVPGSPMPGTPTTPPAPNGSSQEFFGICACPHTLSGRHPLTWSKEDVADWLKWCVKEFSLGGVELQKFSMNGKALCLLTKEGFQHRAPYAGDVLYDLLQKLFRKEFPSSLPSMQMMPPTCTSANDTITVAKHLYATTSRTTKLYKQEEDSADYRFASRPVAETPAPRRGSTERSTDAYSRSHYLDDVRGRKESLPLNLTMQEAANESASDSGCSSGDPTEEQESQPADPLPAVHTYSRLRDHPQAPCRRSPQGHRRRSPLVEDPSRSSSPPGGHGRRSPPVEGFKRRPFPYNPQVPDDCTTSATNPNHVHASHRVGQADHGHRLATWNQYHDGFTTYKISKDGELRAADGRRLRRGAVDTAWKEGHQSLQEKCGRSPVGAHRQRESGEMTDFSSGLFRKSPAEDHHRRTITGSQCRSNDSVIAAEQQGMPTAQHEVPVIKTSAELSNNYVTQREVTNDTAHPHLATFCLDSIPRVVPSRPQDDPSETSSFTVHPGQYPYHWSPLGSQRRISGGGISPKIQSSFQTTGPRHPSPSLECPEEQNGPGRQKGECRLLWDFLYQLLADERYSHRIRWENRQERIFRFVDPDGVANMWGLQKNRSNMTYEKLSRALRYYYNTSIIRKEPGQKLTYRFLQDPEEIANSPRFSKSRKSKPDSKDAADDDVPTEGAISQGNQSDSPASDKEPEWSDTESASSNPTPTATTTDTTETVSTVTDSAATLAPDITIKQEPAYDVN